MAAADSRSPASARDARPVFDPTGRILSVPTRALYDRRVKDYHLALLCTLGDLDARHRDGWFEVSQAEIARFRGKSRSAITNAFSDLVAWGYVEREPQIDAETRRRRANRYRLRFDADLGEECSRHRPSSIGGAGRSHVSGDDLPRSGTSPQVTHNRGYVSGGDIGAPHPDGYVSRDGHTSPGMSAVVTADIRYVSGGDDYLKTLKESEDLKEGAGHPDALGSDRVDAAHLVALFEAVHQTYFGSSCRPDPERLLAEAEAFADDGLPSGLAEMVIDTVFGRLAVKGHRHVSSFKALGRTWSFIAARWREAGQPMDDDGWEDLFDENRYAWRDFQGIYPRADGLKADATRKAFDRAARTAGGAPQIVEAARLYAARMDGKDGRWLKTAERWLTGGHWRDELAEPEGASTPEAETFDHATVGHAAPALASAWPRVVDGLARRFGPSAVKSWLGNVTVQPGSRAGLVVIGTTSRFARDQVENRFGGALTDLLSQALGQPVRAEVTVG